MGTVSLLCIAVGALVIIARAPLLFAPGATLDFYARMLGTDLRVRAWGVGIGALGVLVILPARDGAMAAQFAYLGGGILALVALGLLAATGPFRRLVASILDQIRSSGTTTPRMIGVLGVLAGALLIYLGFWLG